MSESNPAPEGWPSQELYDKFLKSYLDHWIKSNPAYREENVGRARPRMPITWPGLCACCGAQGPYSKRQIEYNNHTKWMTYGKLEDGIVPNLAERRDHIVIRDKDHGDYIFIWSKDL